MNEQMNQPTAPEILEVIRRAWKLQAEELLRERDEASALNATLNARIDHLLDSLESSGNVTKQAEAERDEVMREREHARDLWATLVIRVHDMMRSDEAYDANASSGNLLFVARKRLAELRSELDRLRAVTEAMALAAAAHETQLYEVRRERDEAQGRLERALVTCRLANETASEMGNQRDELRRTLEWYADPVNWATEPDEEETRTWLLAAQVDGQNGWERARLALRDFPAVAWRPPTKRCASGHLSAADRDGCPECEVKAALDLICEEVGSSFVLMADVKRLLRERQEALAQLHAQTQSAIELREELDAQPSFSPGIRLAIEFMECDGKDQAREKRLYAAFLLWAHEHGVPVGARLEVAS